MVEKTAFSINCFGIEVLKGGLKISKIMLHNPTNDSRFVVET